MTLKSCRKSCRGSAPIALLFKDYYQHINADGNPNLGLHRVVADVAKGHVEELSPTREDFHLMLSAIASHTAAKLFRMDEIGDLSKMSLPAVHPGSLAEMIRWSVASPI